MSARALDWLGRGVVAYAGVMLFRRMLNLPVVQYKVQPPELLFLFLFPLALFAVGRRLWPGWSLFLGGTLLYLASLTTASALTGDPGSQLEALGRWYLLLVFLLVVWYVRARGRTGVENILRAWTWGMALIYAAAYLGYGLALADVTTRYVVVYENYPYFGTVWRAASFCGGPTPVAVFGILPLAWQWRRWRTGRGGGWFLALAAPVLLLTFAKEVLLVGLACGLADPLVAGSGPPPPRGGGSRRMAFFVARKRNWLAWALAVPVALLYWGTTHYLVEPARDYGPGDLAGVVYNSGRVAWRGEETQLTESSYVAIKRACLEAARHHPLVGIGADRLEHFTAAAKAEGHYPAHLPAYTPHSTYFGALAETGHLGLLGVLGLLFGAGRMLRRGREEKDAADHALLGFAVAFLIGGMCMDLLHLRFVWVALGLIVGGAASRLP